MTDKSIHGINMNRNTLSVTKVTKERHYDITFAEEIYGKNENLILKGLRIKNCS